VYAEIDEKGVSTWLPSPTLPFHPSYPSSSPPHHLRSMGSLNQLEGLGECCKLPQWGPGHSPSQKRIYSCRKATGGNHFEHS